MTCNGLAAAVPSTAVAANTLSDAVRWRIFLYLGALIIMTDFGGPSGGLFSVPISFLLKNKLHLQAHEASEFKLISSIPLYLSFLFGLARDTWNPFGMRDRGFFVLFGAISACLYIFFAFTPITYPALLVAVVLSATSYSFISAARNGLASTIGQQHVMSGQISAVWNIFGSFVLVIALLIGGPLSDLLENKNADQAARILFLVGAAFVASVALYGAWKPKSVFDNVRTEHVGGIDRFGDLKRLVRHWPLYPAILVWFLWSFAPGSDTPLQYYLQNTFRAKDSQWGQWNAIFAASFIPTFIGFGFLCRKFALRSLLLWGTVVAVPQMVPLLFINSMEEAFITAVTIGLMGGVANAAYLDLMIRSCPRGLQGTTVMIAISLSTIGARFGDRLGTSLYDIFGGFGVCVVATTAVYALILPTLLLVPKNLISTADGKC